MCLTIQFRHLEFRSSWLYLNPGNKIARRLTISDHAKYISRYLAQAASNKTIKVHQLSTAHPDFIAEPLVYSLSPPPLIMSAAPAPGAAPTTKATKTNSASTPSKDQTPAAALEEDDEFEDFPVEGKLPSLPDLVTPAMRPTCRRIFLWLDDFCDVRSVFVAGNCHQQ
jgi:hypothetical protein